MPTDKEMEGYARECVKLASLTNDPKIREQLMRMARDWMEELEEHQQGSGVDRTGMAWPDLSSR